MFGILAQWLADAGSDIDRLIAIFTELSRSFLAIGDIGDLSPVE